jgi:hydrogenase nickel incorporation protein HypA/HybF
MMAARRLEGGSYSEGLLNGPWLNEGFRAKCTMHELSIAQRLIELAIEHIELYPAARVSRLHVRLGALSCLQPHALRSSFEMAVQGGLLEGAELEIERVPLLVYCDRCNMDVAPSSLQALKCPHCGLASNAVRAGRELELEWIELIESADKKMTSEEKGDGDHAIP